MIKNLKEFNLSLEKSVKDLPIEQGQQLVRKVSLEVLRRVVLKTPVDTGRARGSWQTTVNRPPIEEKEVASYTKQTGETVSGYTRGKRGTDKTGSRVINQGLLVLTNYRLGQTVFISSNLSYIEALEHGHSKQAPAGMVAVTLAELS